MIAHRTFRLIAIAGALLAVVIMSLSSCATSTSAPATATDKAVLSLDWVPNTNHTGFYVALDKGWYAEEGIDLTIQTPSDPSAALKQVGAGNTAFGVSFQEELTIARADGIPVVSIAAIIQHNSSAFAALASSGIRTAADFAGKTYASYALPIERPILEGLMECEGADASTVEFVDVGFDAFPALLAGRVDLAWIFLGWDGVQAQLKGVDLATVPLYPSCVPDYYTPIVIAGEKTLAEQPELTRRFLQATRRGYEYAIANPAEAAEILLKYTPETDPALVRASQEWLSPRYQDDAVAWGVQATEVWEEFSRWLYENGLIDQPVDASQAFTNEYLPE